MPELSRATRDRLGDILPTRSGIINPVDFAGLAEEDVVGDILGASRGVSLFAPSTTAA